MSPSAGWIAAVNVSTQKVVENAFVIEVAPRLKDGQGSVEMVDSKLNIVVSDSGKAANSLNVAQYKKVICLICFFDCDQSFFAIFGFAEIEICLGQDQAGHAGEVFVTEFGR